MKLLDVGVAEIRNGNTLIISCQGKKPDGSEHCGGWIRVPFQPTIGDASLAPPNPTSPGYWTRESGETIDDITLSPSIDAQECGHFHIRHGEVTL